MTNKSDTVLYAKAGAVARITLNRPTAINALDMNTRDGLYLALEAVRDDDEVRVAVLRGAGDRGFCAGADLTEFGTAPSQAIARKVRWERDLWGLFLAIRKPIIAAMHGYVLGAGVEMACLCDIRIASRDAVFGLPEVALGMVPAAGGTQTLPRIVGQGAGLEMLLTGRRLDAAEALAAGLVHRVVPVERLDEAAESQARELAARPAGVLAAAQTAILEGMDLTLEDGLRLEQRLASQLSTR